MKTNFEKLRKALVYIKNNLIDSDRNICLTINFLIETNNKITVSNNYALRKNNVKPYRFDKQYMNKDPAEDKLYQVIDQFNTREIVLAKFYSIFLNEIHPFYD